MQIGLGRAGWFGMGTFVVHPDAAPRPQLAIIRVRHKVLAILYHCIWL